MAVCLEGDLYRKADVNIQTVTFMITLFAYFSSVELWGDLFVHETRDEFVKAMISTFCNGVKITQR